MKSLKKIIGIGAVGMLLAGVLLAIAATPAICPRANNEGSLGGNDSYYWATIYGIRFYPTNGVYFKTDGTANIGDSTNRAKKVYTDAIDLNGKAMVAASGTTDQMLNRGICATTNGTGVVYFATPYAVGVTPTLVLGYSSISGTVTNGAEYSGLASNKFSFAADAGSVITFIAVGNKP